MNWSLWKKSMGEARLLLAGSALVMFVFCWLRVWIVSFFPMPRFQNIMEQFRDFEHFLPVPFEQLFTYANRVALTYDELIVVMVVSVWAIARGSDCVSGELSRGTMEMVLGQPINRLQLLCTQSAVTVGGLVILAAVSWLGIYTGIQTNSVEEKIPVFIGTTDISPLIEGGTVTVPMSERVDSGTLLTSAFNLFALGFFLAGLSTLMSSWDRYRWRTIGIVAAIFTVQLIVKIVGRATGDLNWMANFTFFTAYEPQYMVTVAVNTPEQSWSLLRDDGQGQWVAGPLGYSLILCGLGTIFFAAAARIFCRRDLPAPL